MSLELPFGIKPVNPVAVDYYSGPWSGASTQEAINAANSGIPAAVRFTGLTANLVIAGEAKKYWYASGISDSHLVNFGDTLFDGNASISGTPSGVAFFNSNGVLSDDPKFRFESINNMLIFGDGSTVSQSGISFETTGGTHEISVKSNILTLDSYNRIKMYNGGDVWLDSKGGQTGSSTPRFLRGITLEPLTNLLQPLVIEGKTSQAGNLTEWIDDVGTVLAHVDSGGNAMFRDLTVDNMTVSGTFTYVNSENVTIADKQIELASNSGSAIGGDSLVDQGGIVVKSTDGDKSFLWSQSSNAWTANKNLVVQGTITNPAIQTFSNTNTVFYGDIYPSTFNQDIGINNTNVWENIYGKHLHALDITLSGVSTGYWGIKQAGGSLYFSYNGDDKLRWRQGQSFCLEGDDSFAIGSSTNVADVHLYRDAAGTWGQRNGTNAQQFNIYNTYTDASNYERLEVKWDSNVAMIEATSDGTGSNRVFAIGNGLGNSVAEFSTAGIRSAAVKPKSDSVFELGGTSLRWLNTYTDTITIGNGVDAVLTADADNELALRNGTDPQKLSVYATYTDASNYERLTIGMDGPVFAVQPEASGTGSEVGMRFGNTSFANPAYMTFSTGGDITLYAKGINVTTIQHDNVTFRRAIRTSVDSTFDIGQAATKFRTIFADTINVGDGFGANITADADHEVALRNGTDAQQFNIYNTYTDASNYERLEISNTQDGFNFNTESAGTGSSQNLSFSRAGSLKYVIGGNFNQFYAKINPASNGLYSCGTSSLRWSNTYTNAIDVEAGSAADVPAVIKGAVAQSANLTEWQDSVGNALAHVGSGGTISTSGDLVANTFLKFKGGNGPDIYSTSSHAYLRDATGASKLRWGTGGNVFMFTGFVPNTPNLYDIGEEGNRVFRSLHLGSRVTSSGVQTSGVHLSDHVPASITNTLYNDGGELKWNGSAIGGSVSGTPSGVGFFGSDGLLSDAYPYVYYDSGVDPSTAGTGTLYFANMKWYEGASNRSVFRAINNVLQSNSTWIEFNNADYGIRGGSSQVSDLPITHQRAGFGTKITGGGATATPLKVQGAAAQTANLTEWQNSAGENLAIVDSGGNIATSGDITVGFGGNTPQGSLLFPLTDGTFSRIHATSQAIRVQGYTGVTNMEFDRYFNYTSKTIRPSYGQMSALGYDNQGFGDAYIQRLKLQKSQFANATRLAQNMMEVQNASGYLSTIIDSSGDMHFSSGNSLYFNNYYGDENNYERLEVKWDTNEAVLTTTAAGSGTPRGLKLQSNGGNFTIDAASSVAIKAVGAVSITAYNSIYQQFTTTGVGYRKDCYPIFDSSLDLGTTALRWGTTYTNTIDVEADSSTDVPAVIKGAASQSANLTEWQVSDGTVVAMVEPDGSISSSGDISASGSLRSSRFMASDDGSLTAPAFSFDSETNMGIYRSAIYQLNITCGANYGINLSPQVLSVTSGTALSWRTGNDLNSGHSFSTQLHQEANGVIGQYSEYLLEHYTPQQYNIYNYWGGNTSNWERLETKWDNHTATIQTAAAGSGVVRSLAINGDTVELQNSGGTKFQVGTDNKSYVNLRPSSNGSLDLGSRFLRWRAIFANGAYHGVTSISADTTLAENHNAVLCDASSGTITVTLPASANYSGIRYHIKKTDSSSNVITISPDGSETIDGQSSYVVNNQYESITLVCDGSNWFII